MGSNTQLIKKWRRREFKWHLPVPTQRLWQSQDTAAFTRLSAMFSPLCSFSEEAGLGEASEDGRAWTGREDEVCFTIEQGPESKSVKWNADDSPGGQVETACWLKGGFRQRNREEWGAEIDWRGAGECDFTRMCGSRSLSWEMTWENLALGGSMIESNYAQMSLPEHTVHTLLSLSVPQFLHLTTAITSELPYCGFGKD